MEPNWLILIIVLIVLAALFVFFIIRNRKDKNDLIEKLNKGDETETPIPEERDSEDNF